MAENSHLKAPLRIVWKIEIPQPGTPRTSRKFLLFGFEWYLRIEMCVILPNYYRVSLNNGARRDDLKEFMVTTFMEHPSRTSDRLLIQNIHVKPKYATKVIWKTGQEEILKHVSDFLDYGEMTIVVECNHPYLDYDLTSYSRLSQIKFETINISTPTAFDRPSDLESLSLDFCNLLDHEILPDVQLRCGDRSFSAHRTVLAARSEVFAAMFRNKMTESETGLVDIVDLDASVFGLFLKYLYSGKIPDLTDDTARRLYAASDEYAVPSLKKACSKWMIGHLATENCLSLLIVADSHSDEDFKDLVVHFVAEHLPQLNGDSWTRFKKEQPRLSEDVYEMHLSEKALEETARKTQTNVSQDPHSSRSENNSFDDFECAFENYLKKLSFASELK